MAEGERTLICPTCGYEIVVPENEKKIPKENEENGNVSGGEAAELGGDSANKYVPHADD